jgi:predicted HAD superfamily Cof-like phosphohydrolase
MTHKMQEQVAEFHREFDHPTPKSPTLDHYRADLRAKLVLEEALEFVKACGFELSVSDGFTIIQVHDIKSLEFHRVREPDWPAMIDALGDTQYVTYGSFVEMGCDAEPYCDEIHRSNMAKRGGARRPDGKTLKPASWTPPDIEGILSKERQAAALQMPLELGDPEE